MNSLVGNNTMARCTCEGSAMLLIIMIIVRIYLFFDPFKFVQYEKLEILTASCLIPQGPVSQCGIVNGTE